MSRPLSRRQKFRVYNATIEQLEARWRCQTCTDVIEFDYAIYCRHCRTYWEDCANGLFDFDCGAELNHHCGAVEIEKPIRDLDF
jgi:hypothetical protein